MSHISLKGLAQGLREAGDLACYQESSAEPQNHLGQLGVFHSAMIYPGGLVYWPLGGGKLVAQLDPNALVLLEVHLSKGCMRGGTTEVFSSTTSLRSWARRRIVTDGIFETGFDARLMSQSATGE